MEGGEEDEDAIGAVVARRRQVRRRCLQCGAAAGARRRSTPGGVQGWPVFPAAPVLLSWKICIHLGRLAGALPDQIDSTPARLLAQEAAKKTQKARIREKRRREVEEALAEQVGAPACLRRPTAQPQGLSIFSR